MVNLIRGVAERVLFVSEGGVLRPTRQPLPKVFDRLNGLKIRLLKYLRPTTVVPAEDYPALYSGRKQKIYQQAYESLTLRGLRRSDGFVNTFVKAEKVNFSAKVDPAPRVIQPRSPRYILSAGRYLKLFEKELLLGFKKMFGYRVVVKGLNADAVAAQLHENWCAFENPVAVGLDASRFDQHVSVDALKFEHSVYNSVFKSKELARLLSWQLNNTGFGRIGKACLKYSVDGCRMSGDINTGMGNCLIMSMVVIGFCESVGVRFRLSNNGDDCVVFVNKCDLHLLEGIDAWFTEFGFKLKREPPVYVFEKVEFCQTQPVLLSSGYRMVRNPWTAMSKDCVSLLNMETHDQFDRWRDAIGVCGIELTRGVPVWESFYRAISTGRGLKGGVERVYESGMGYMARGVCEAVVTSESRVSFWRAFNIDPDMQIILEGWWPQIVYDPEPPLISLQDSNKLPNNPLSCLQRH
jgi:hypothetical protein